MISNNLKSIRESKNMSQDYVAKTLNISRQAISRWENQRSVPDTENLVALSQLYSVSLDELIGVSNADEAVSNSTNSKENWDIKGDTVKVLLYSVILIISIRIFFIGIVVSLIFLIKLRKQNYPKIFYALCVLCCLICIIEFFVLWSIFLI